MSKTQRSSKTVPRPGCEEFRPPTVRRRNGTSEGKEHMGNIAAMPCVLCLILGTPQTSKTDVHHIREGAGAGQRNSDFLTVPLCHDGCHQGVNGIHGDKSLLMVAGVTELDLLAETIKMLQS